MTPPQLTCNSLVLVFLLLFFFNILLFGPGISPTPILTSCITYPIMWWCGFVSNTLIIIVSFTLVWSDELYYTITHPTMWWCGFVSKTLIIIVSFTFVWSELIFLFIRYCKHHWSKPHLISCCNWSLSQSKQYRYSSLLLKDNDSCVVLLHRETVQDIFVLSKLVYIFFFVIVDCSGCICFFKICLFT